MLIHTIDKCIFSKVKWILALDMASAASRHLNLSVDLAATSMLRMAVETETGEVKDGIMDMAGFGTRLVMGADVEMFMLNGGRRHNI
jgi:hypothetical protein